MGKSSEEFIKHRERLQESTPLIDSNFSWGNYFKELGETYKTKQNETRDI